MSGISTNRSNITLPTELSSEIIQKTQESSAVMRLARQIALPGRGVTIPVITSDPEANWVAETAAKPVSNPGLSQKVMTPYKLAVIVPFSDEFRRDAAALYDQLVARLPGALAKKFDFTVFNGTAPGTGFDVLSGCTAQSIAVNASGVGGFYSALVAADVDIAAAGGDLNGFAMSPQARGEMLSALDKDGRPIFINNVAEGAIPRLLGQPVMYSRGLYGAGNAASGSTAAKPDTIGFAGDWTKAMYGTVEGVQVSISDQATLTISNTAVNLWEHNMFAVRAEIEVGFVADTYCFNKITRTHA
ncbi:MAG: phage major capsid protein [Lachnospiraceae bacterium]|nr:phage major capsid protein [Lachnospiraceae bacterium]